MRFFSYFVRHLYQYGLPVPVICKAIKVLVHTRCYKVRAFWNRAVAMFESIATFLNPSPMEYETVNSVLFISYFEMLQILDTHAVCNMMSINLV